MTHVRSRTRTSRRAWLAAPALLAALALTASAQEQGAFGAGDAQPRAISIESGRAPIIAPPPLPVSRLLTDPSRAAGAWTIAPVALAPVDAAALTAEDDASAGIPGIPLRIGVNRPAPDGGVTPVTHGEWRVDADGTRVWALELDGANAFGLRVHFARFKLPAGARLLIVDDTGLTVESYEGDGPMHGQPFWAVLCEGARQLIEYQDPLGRVAPPELEIDELSHVYRSPYGDGVARGGLLDCQKDVNCYLNPPESVSTNARDSVGRMVYTDGGSFLCSGALLNDADPNTFAGWFLTANHCISTQTAAGSLQVWWFYQSSSCNGSVPNLNTLPRSVGAVLLAHSDQTDFSFMRFNNDPNFGQGYAGFTTLDVSTNDQLVGIHHPGGSWKRVSFGHRTLAGPFCGVELPQTRFWYNDWDLGTDGQFKGVTEGGSSGSPLFNPSWQVIGQLYGVCASGDPACDNPANFNNIYGKLGISYAIGSLGTWLSTGIPDDSYEHNDTQETAATFSSGDSANLILVDFDDYFTVKMCGAGTLTATATYTTSQMDLDMELRNAGGTVLASATGSSSPKIVNASVAAGTYYVRCYKNAGWGGSYTLAFSRSYSCTASSDVDANCLGNPVDVARFVSILLNGGATPQELCRCDFSGDGAVDADDVDAFVADYVP